MILLKDVKKTKIEQVEYMFVKKINQNILSVYYRDEKGNEKGKLLEYESEKFLEEDYINLQSSQELTVVI